MKVVNAPPEMEPAVEMECDCGHKFWVDPCGEENLIGSTMKPGYLIEVCPNCGKVGDQYGDK